MSNRKTAATTSKAQPTRLSWKQLFSLTTIGLLVTVTAALVAFLQLQQDRRIAESSDRANATVVAALGQQLELSKQIATSQASGPQIGPMATAAAESIARAEATRDVLEKIQRQAQATLTAMSPRSSEEATLRIEVYHDRDNSGTITQSDEFYVWSDLQVGFNGNQLIVKDVRAYSSVQVPPGQRYEFSGLIGLAPSYRDVSAQCGSVPTELGGCPLVANPPKGGQDTVKLLVQRLSNP